MPVFRTAFASARCIRRYLDAAGELYRLPQSPGRMMVVAGRDLESREPVDHVRAKAKATWPSQELRQRVHVYVDCGDGPIDPATARALGRSRDGNLRFYLLQLHDDPAGAAPAPPQHA